MTPTEQLTAMLAGILDAKDGVTDQYMRDISEVSKVPAKDWTDPGRRRYTKEEIEEAIRAARKLIYG